MALVAGSLAINAGNPAQIGTMDQRGILRGTSGSYTGSNADIGAYEAQLIGVTADNQTVTYGTAPILTYTITSGPENASSLLTGAISLNKPKTNAGTYKNDIGPGTLAAGGSPYPFVIDFTAGTLVINPMGITVTVNSGGTSQYGLAPTNPGIALTGGSLAYSDTLTSLGIGDDFGLTSASNAGSYGINVTGYAALRNYTVTAFSANYVITQAPITVAVNGSGTSQYGLNPANPGIAVTNGSFYNGDTLSGLGIGDDFNLTSSSNAGSYGISVTGFSGLANYAVTAVSANYVITQAPITVAVNGSGTSQYGLNPANPGIAVTNGSFYNGDTLSGLGIGDDFNLTSSSNAGSYGISVTGFSGLANYAVTAVSANYVITQAPITVAVNGSGTSQYGLNPTNPGIAVTNGSFYNGDTLSGLGIGDDFNLTSSSNAGSYVINVTGASQNNYTVTGDWCELQHHPGDIDLSGRSRGAQCGASESKLHGCG